MDSVTAKHRRGVKPPESGFRALFYVQDGGSHLMTEQKQLAKRPDVACRLADTRHSPPSEGSACVAPILSPRTLSSCLTDGLLLRYSHGTRPRGRSTVSDRSLGALNPHTQVSISAECLALARLSGCSVFFPSSSSPQMLIFKGIQCIVDLKH